MIVLSLQWLAQLSSNRINNLQSSLFHKLGASSFLFQSHNSLWAAPGRQVQLHHCVVMVTNVRQTNINSNKPADSPLIGSLLKYIDLIGSFRMNWNNFGCNYNYFHYQLIWQLFSRFVSENVGLDSLKSKMKLSNV